MLNFLLNSFSAILSRLPSPKDQRKFLSPGIIMKGYAKLGLLMGEFPEVAIFRRFSALSAQNLLYLQAELRHLEVDLRKYAQNDDESSHRDRKDYSLDWIAFRESSDELVDEGNDGRQWETVMAIRNKLEEYRSFSLLVWMKLRLK